MHHDRLHCNSCMHKPVSCIVLICTKHFSTYVHTIQVYVCIYVGAMQLYVSVANRNPSFNIRVM